MTTANPRINVTLGDDAAKALALLAKQEHKSVSSVAKELILDALERREDMALSALARTRDTEERRALSHDEAWEE